jgi:Vitamin K-dependent gamma-carboxylase
VYVFAGLAKINYDWLVLALPLKIWLPAHYDLPLLGFLFEYKMTPYVFSWAGMLYDLSIPFLLLYHVTRPWAYISVIFFHVLTGMLFQIGVFPLVMMSGTLLFFSDTFHQRIIGGLRKVLFFMRNHSPEVQVDDSYTYPSRWHKVLLSLVGLHFIIQVLFPFRYLLYPGNLFWTEEGYRYSWRVMLMEKAGTATFYIKDAITGKEGAVINSDFLNLHQEKQMAMQPDMILEFAHFLAAHYKAQGVADPKVRAEVYVTLNARPSKLFIDPQRDLVTVKDTWAHKTWIINGEE